MPFGHARPSPASPDRDAGLESNRRVMPLGSIGRTQFDLSWTVFVALAILVGVVLNVSRHPGNSDLSRAALWGMLFWASGWLTQGLTQLVLTFVLGLRLPSLSIGLLGVESSPRAWPARSVLMVALATVTSLLLLGGFYRLVEGDFQVPVLSREAGSVPIWSAPSLGFSPQDSIWRTAAWLCFAQAACQMYPLPRTLGRQIFSSLVGLCGRRLDVPSQAVLFRRCLDAVSMTTLAVAVFLAFQEDAGSRVDWIFCLLLSVLLWISTRTGTTLQLEHTLQLQADSDQSDWNRAGHSAEFDPLIRTRRPGFIRSALHRWQQRRDDRRVQLAHQQEQEEAVDVNRLDEILNRLHSNGIESLGDEDRTILKRVSKSLRQQRDSGPDLPDRED